MNELGALLQSFIGISDNTGLYGHIARVTNVLQRLQSADESYGSGQSLCKKNSAELLRRVTVKL